jgi:hypothetical protein
MSAAGYIRRHIYKFVGDKPFSIRECLIYGPRNVVDQVFHRMLKQGRIVRVARGVYIKSSAPQPKVNEIIEVKAKAFYRTIAIHGSQAAGRLNKQFRAPEQLVFASSGASSSFKIGNKTVRFVRTSDRKLKLGNSTIGLTIRALWHLGKKFCDTQTAALMVFDFRKNERKELRLSASIMPQWMRDCFATFARMNCQRWDVERIDADRSLLPN